MSDDRLTTVQEFFQRFFNGHLSQAVELLDPSVEYRLPGEKRLRRIYKGRAEVAEHLEWFLGLTKAPVDVLKWDDWLVGSSHVAGVVRFELQRPGRIKTFRVVFLVTVSFDNKISQIELFYSDPDAFDRFLNW